MAKKASIKTSVKQDHTAQIKRNLSAISNNRVLIGIPEGSAGDSDISNAQKLWLNSHGVRTPDQWTDIYGINIAPNGVPYSEAYNKFSETMDQDGYNAAYQLYMQSEGSPLWRIPPRPVLEPAIAANSKEIATAMKSAAQAALDGGDVLPHLNDAGVMAMNAARNWFDDPRNMWPPNAPSTIKSKGSNHPMIDTSSMRDSITYVIEKKGD